ncbi:MAG: hypothetical protein HKP30_07685 [Myxococcales bacterium]|nr:hypothetical protein [Myxococcales bacterium]
MHRLLALGCALFMGCAATPKPSAQETALAPVDAAPPACEALFARVAGARSSSAESPTWLDSPVQMAEARRLRALEARAEALGCRLPNG